MPPTLPTPTPTAHRLELGDPYNFLHLSGQWQMAKSRHRIRRRQFVDLLSTIAFVFQESSSIFSIIRVIKLISIPQWSRNIKQITWFYEWRCLTVMFYGFSVGTSVCWKWTYQTLSMVPISVSNLCIYMIFCAFYIGLSIAWGLCEALIWLMTHLFLSSKSTNLHDVLLAKV